MNPDDIDARAEQLRSRYGRRARAVAQAEAEGRPYYDDTPAHPEQTRRGPLRSGSAPIDPPKQPDALERELRRQLGLGGWR